MLENSSFVYSASMARREMEVDPVALITQEGFPCLFRFQDAGFALYSKLILDSAMVGNQTHHAIGKMGIEIVSDDAPLPVRGGAQEAVEKGSEILLGTSVADCLDHIAGDHIEGGDQGFCAVAFVFEFPALDLPRSHRQRGRQPLQRLNTGHFVDQDRAHLVCIIERRAVELADIAAFGVKVGVEFRRQPGE